jgi:hypothetical protein
MDAYHTLAGWTVQVAGGVLGLEFCVLMTRLSQNGLARDPTHEI